TAPPSEEVRGRQGSSRAASPSPAYTRTPPRLPESGGDGAAAWSGGALPLHVLGCAAGQAEREQPPARGGPTLLQQPRRLVVQVRGDHGHDRGHRALIQVEADAGRLPDDDAHDVRDHGPDHRCEHAHSPSPVWTSSRTVTRSICSVIRATSASTSTASSRAASAAAISRIAAPSASTSGTSRSTPSAAMRE